MQDSRTDFKGNNFVRTLTRTWPFILALIGSSTSLIYTNTQIATSPAFATDQQKQMNLDAIVSRLESSNELLIILAEEILSQSSNRTDATQFAEHLLTIANHVEQLRRPPLYDHLLYAALFLIVIGVLWFASYANSKNTKHLAGAIATIGSGITTLALTFSFGIEAQIDSLLTIENVGCTECEATPIEDINKDLSIHLAQYPELHVHSISPFETGEVFLEEKTNGIADQLSERVCETLKTDFDGTRQVLIIGSHSRMPFDPKSSSRYRNNQALAKERAEAVMVAINGCNYPNLTGYVTTRGPEFFAQNDSKDRAVYLIEVRTAAAISISQKAQHSQGIEEK